MSSSSNTPTDTLEAHRLIRNKHALKKEEELDKLKGEGNQYFNEGEYIEAASYYVHAINIYGPKSVLLSNLAAAYLKLELYEEALWAATTALEFDPKMAKARYRRAMARKGLSFYKGALKDMETVVAATPTDQIVKELEIVRKLAESSEEKDHHGKKENDIAYPSQDGEPWELYDDSDTEDSKHIGNTVSCRFYNHQGCRRAKDCDFSHTPDNKSVRDELGKNVCLDFLFDECRFGGTKCIYSHDKTYLPENGWWEDKAKIRAAKRFRQELGMDVTFAGYDIVHKFLRANPKANNYAARDLRQAIVEHLNMLHENSIEKLESHNTQRASGSKDRFVLTIALELNDLFTDIHEHLLSTLRSQVKVVEISTPEQASQKASEYFDSSNLAGVIVCDSGILEKKNKALLDKLVRYVKNGGSVVLGGTFSSFVTPPKFDSFMKKTWNLNWKFGSYHRTTFQLNPDNELVKRNPSMAQSYSMKSVHIKGIQPQQAIYVPVDGARLQSLVFPPVKITNTTESPAVCARIEKGLLSFLGDVNAEIDSTNTVLAMLGLLDASNELQPPETTSSLSSSATDKKKGKAKDTFAQTSQAHGSASSDKTEQSESPQKSGFVLILALSNRDMFERIYEDQLSALKKKVDIKFAETCGRAVEYLGLSNIRGALIADDGIAKSSNSPALLKVVDYAKNGGLVLIGGLFSSLSETTDISRTFKLFDVPWQQGSYTRCEVQLNRDHEVAKVNVGKLRNTTTLKAVLVSGYDQDDVIYRQAQRDVAEEVPVVRRKFGKGRLGYIGDVNAEPGLTPTVLAMFDLLNENTKKDMKLLPDSQKFFIVLTPDSVGEGGPSTSAFLKDAKQKAEVLCGLSNARVIDLLSSSDLLGVLVPNSYILQERNAYLLSKLVAHAKQGGTVVFGLAFAQQVKPDQFNPFFRENWGLDWNLLNDSVNTVVYQNPQGPLVGKSKLPGEFWLESMYVKVPAQTTPVYFTERPARLWNASEKNFHAPILFADVDRGHVGFIGASNMDGEVRSIFYAMVELL